MSCPQMHISLVPTLPLHVAPVLALYIALVPLALFIPSLLQGLSLSLSCTRAKVEEIVAMAVSQKSPGKWQPWYNIHALCLPSL